LAPELAHSLLVVDGMLTHTIGDCAALLDVLAGPETGDACWAPPPADSFAALAQRPPARARIGYTTVSPIPEASVDAVCAEAVERAAELLRELGHEVVEVEPPWPREGLVERFGMLFSIHIAMSIDYSGQVAGREPQEQDMEPMSYAIYSLAKRLSAIQGLALETELLASMRSVAKLISGYDAILTPALAERPLALGALDTYASEPLGTFTRSGYFTPFTALFNASGHPAITLPLLAGADGLPLAVQLAGRPADEGTLLALGAQLEAATGWAARRPPVALG
jgi:amidase